VKHTLITMDGEKGDGNLSWVGEQRGRAGNERGGD